MKMQTSLALPPRALRRNRILLAAFVVAVTPLAGMATGVLSSRSQPGPLLLAIDEMKVEGAKSTPAITPQPAIAPAKSESLAQVVNESSAESQPSRVNDPFSRRFNGRPIKPVRTIAMLVTAYSPDSRSCGESADGITASGYSVWTNSMKLAAADTSILQFGTMISVPGYDDGEVIPVLDRGGAIKGNRLDVLHPSHEQALQWGTQRLEITVWEYADGLPGDFVPRYNKASAVKN